MRALSFVGRLLGSIAMGTAVLVAISLVAFVAMVTFGAEPWHAVLVGGFAAGWAFDRVNEFCDRLWGIE